MANLGEVVRSLLFLGQSVNTTKPYFHKHHSRVAQSHGASCGSGVEEESPWLDEDSRPCRAGQTFHKCHSTCEV